MNAVRRAIGDSGEQQRLIRTIARKGYRFVGDVVEQDAGAVTGSVASAVDRSDPQAGHSACPISRLSLFFRSRISPAIPTGVFCRRHHRGHHDGIVAIPLVVRDRTQFSFVFKGKTVDAKQIARELGVRYLLEGSVRRAVNRLRIIGQLVDASSGSHLWADRFDGAVDDVFDLHISAVGLAPASESRRLASKN